MPRTSRAFRDLSYWQHDQLIGNKDCRENKLKGSVGTSSQKSLKTRLRGQDFIPKEMLKDKHESFTIGWHVRKLFLAVLWRRKGVKQEWSLLQLFSQEPMVAWIVDWQWPERRSLNAAHTPAHDKLEQREVEVPWIQCQAIGQSLNRQDGCRIKAKQKVVETQQQS